MAILTLQLDLRLRKLTPDGLEDCVGTFTHYDLPLDAASNDWTEAERQVVFERAYAHLADVLATSTMGLLDHCRWEQPELPFG
jgi:hypothetical protein